MQFETNQQRLLQEHRTLAENGCHFCTRQNFWVFFDHAVRFGHNKVVNLLHKSLSLDHLSLYLLLSSVFFPNATRTKGYIRQRTIETIMLEWKNWTRKLGMSWDSREHKTRTSYCLQRQFNTELNALYDQMVGLCCTYTLSNQLCSCRDTARKRFSYLLDATCVCSGVRPEWERINGPVHTQLVCKYTRTHSM